MSLRYWQSGVVLLTLSLTCSAACADLIVPIAQTRYVEAVWLHDSPMSPPYSYEDRIDATDFGPFDATAEVHESLGDSTAYQHSTITGDAIVGRGSVGGSSDGPPVSVSGTSSLSVTFEITEPVEYRLFGYLAPERDELFPFGTTTCKVELQGPSGSFYMEEHFLNPDPEQPIMPVWPYDESGQLTPGTYTLSASVCSGGEPGGGSVGDYSVHLSVVPEPSAIVLVALASLFARRR